MSAKATFWAWSLRGLSSSQKLLLLCLSDNHNGDNNRCDPSINYISDKTGLNRKTVMNSVSELVSLGLISVHKRNGTSTLFELKTSTNFGTSTDLGPVPILDKTSTDIGHGPVPISVPKSITESKKNLKHSKSKNKLDFSRWRQMPSDEVWSDYKKLRSAKKAPISQTVLNSMAKEIDKLPNLTVDQILTECINRGWQGLKSEWFKSNQSGVNHVKPKESLSERSQREAEAVFAKLREGGKSEHSLEEINTASRPSFQESGGSSLDGEWTVLD